jgi:hypothetical protein
MSISCPQFTRADIRSSASQLVFLCDSFVLFVQISDPILKLAVVALWKTRDYHVDAGWRVRAARGRPISYNLADAKFVGWHRLEPQRPAAITLGRLRLTHDGQIGLNHLTFRLTADVLPRLSSSSNSTC